MQLVEPPPLPGVIDVAGLSPELAIVALLPTMAHPREEDRRGLLEAWIIGKLHAAADLPLPRGCLPRLVAAAEVGVGSDLTEATHGGCMAGDVLLTLLELGTNQAEDLSLNKAWHIVSGQYTHCVDRQGDRFRASIDTVRAHWKRFRPVAHLWAAHLVLVRQAEEYSADPFALDGQHLAALAEGFRLEAAKFILPLDQPLLPRDAVPIRGAAQVSWMQAPDNRALFKAALASFTGRSR